MNCWGTRKLLSLYCGKSDLPFFQNYVERHLQKCSACDDISKSYECRRQDLSILTETHIPPELFDGYWDKIQASIQPEKEPEVFPLRDNVFARPWLPFRNSIAFALCLFVIVLVAGPFVDTTSTPHATSDIRGSWWSLISNEEPAVDVSAEMKILLQYKLDNVTPCMQEEEVSF